MTPSRKTPRKYDATRRRAAAEETRSRILTAAHDLFLAHGFAGVSVSAIAEAAQVSVDTVYTSVGRKPRLLLTVVDMVLASSSRPEPAERRDYVVEVRAAAGAKAKITTYAEALGRLMPTVAPLLLALRDAGLADSDCRAMWEHVNERRAANMLLLAADLRETGELRADLSDQDVADLVWSMNGPEWFRQWQSRGRSPEQYAAILADVWARTLLAGIS